MTTQPSGANDLPTTPDANMTDRQLDAGLNAELSVLEQDPAARSGWAAGLGVTIPTLDLGGGGGGSRGYMFSPSELDAVINQWDSVIQRAKSYDAHIYFITSVTSAADDGASTTFTSQARNLGRNVQASHESLKQYAAAYVAKLRAVQRNYNHTEQSVTSALEQAPHK
jgi:hypothetical protein